MVLHVAHNLHAAGSPMQRLPYLQQHTFAVLLPLMIPKTQLLNVLGFEEFFSCLVMFLLFRCAMVESIQFDGKPRGRTIAVDEKFSPLDVADEI